MTNPRKVRRIAFVSLCYYDTRQRDAVNGEPSITDGPYVESKRQVGALVIIEAKDLNEAIRVAPKHPLAHLGEHVGWGIEVRPIESFDQA